MNLTKEQLKGDFTLKLKSMYAKGIEEATDIQRYMSFSRVIRDYISEGWLETNKSYKDKKVKQVYYLSMEFLIGKMLNRNLINYEIKDICEEALKELGIELSTLVDLEPDAGLGNGGLGRLAACFMDSLAALELPGHGCGIRYKYGLFRQEIKDGYQVEVPDLWLKENYPWEVRKENRAVDVKFGGNAYTKETDVGKIEAVHEGYYTVRAVPYDIPLSGYENDTVNTLRLWSAEAVGGEFDFSDFSSGNYLQSVEGKYTAEMISQVLYPDDSTENGRMLRLKQEYFFVSASIQAILNYYRSEGTDFKKLDKYIAIHINDTHPALAVAELMRVLMDVEEFEWEEAWALTTKICAYTNHTIMAEALEKWNIHTLRGLLPRIYMIIDEINTRFCRELMETYGDQEKIRRMAIIEDSTIKMANLSIVGSHSVNGVARLHTEILKNQELKDFYEHYPEKFNNKTNGITHRRWLIKSNTELTDYIDSLIGEGWKKDPNSLEKLLKYVGDENVYSSIEGIKREKKKQLASYIKEKNNINVDSNSIFDIQVKRIHGYKRQLMNCLHIIYLYTKLKKDRNFTMHPRTFIFSAKAAPAYYFAKSVIKLINTLGELINNDSNINHLLKVIFIANYGVSKAEKIIPAADISEQISTASKEASGTGNMKFMMNGAVTLATLDGANVEIDELVGRENIKVFGMTSEEVINLNKDRTYNSKEYLESEPMIKEMVESLIDGTLGVSVHEFSDIYKHLTDENDPFFVLKDFWAYAKAQKELEADYRNRDKWNKMCLINIAKSGYFSSDNTIKKYAEEIWDIKKNS